MKTRRSWLISGMATIEAGFVIAICVYFADPVNPGDVARIRHGMSEAEVIRLLGAPTQPRKWREKVVFLGIGSPPDPARGPFVPASFNPNGSLSNS
ncbi:MAG: hypothetical protein EXR98_02300 [Gemmataceae bacterium]|nr:hypothetical protein [Gemmataceae bacterium]